MWTDITNKSKVQLVWQETVVQQGDFVLRHRAEFTVVRFDTAKAGTTGTVYIIYRSVGSAPNADIEFGDDDTGVSLLRDNLIKMSHYGPSLSQVAGDEAYVTRHFSNMSDHWFALIKQLADRIYAHEEARDEERP